MISSPLLSDLVRTLRNVPDPAGNLSACVRGLRMAEADLRRALDDIESAPSRLERQICVARRNRAMQELVAALQDLTRVLQQEPSL
jgi:hypothetical protein